MSCGCWGSVGREGSHITGNCRTSKSRKNMKNALLLVTLAAAVSLRCLQQEGRDDDHHDDAAGHGARPVDRRRDDASRLTAAPPRRRCRCRRLLGDGCCRVGQRRRLRGEALRRSNRGSAETAKSRLRAAFSLRGRRRDGADSADLQPGEAEHRVGDDDVRPAGCPSTAASAPRTSSGRLFSRSGARRRGGAARRAARPRGSRRECRCEWP